ncbi:MAG: hypothetical protein GY822_17785 [Deltaproteobacteria bacterium]|nr:hypothetical protein [Deltaproteobacteria bacterium]
MKYRSFRSVLFLSAMVTSLVTSSTHAQTGVSDDRVSLPDGPGSLDGIGNNASVNQNMGMMSHSVNIKTPEGYGGLNPGIGLGYSSAGGASIAGIGWSFSLPTIERMTARGLPDFDDSDVFVANGGSELVKTEGGADGNEDWTYRARFEGGFAKYTWHERGNGDEGYWTSESGGITSYYGADSSGTLVETARQRSFDGVFSYLLVEKTDLFGHHIEFDYRYYGSVPLIDTISYAFHNGTPENVVSFEYEGREDLVSDAKAGFNELLAHRLKGITTKVGGAQLNRYAISYESYATSGGKSRISQVQRFGMNDGEHPAKQMFEYSKGLGGECNDVDCTKPYLVTVGNIGQDLKYGNATLMDMNGDALPDFLVTKTGQAHDIHLAEIAVDGLHTYSPGAPSALGSVTSGFELSSPYVQVLDYNGDGFTDLINAQLSQVLVNDGSGDWKEVSGLTGDLPNFGDDFDLGEDTDLAHIRFLDYDLDHKIDVIRSESTTTSIYKNSGQNGFAIDVDVQAIGAGFSDERLEFADMNGDGLLDPVILREGQVSYKLNLGRGKWSGDWFDLNAPVSTAELDFASFEDLNGDGLDDLVIVVANELRYALNRNASSYADTVTLTMAQSQATGDDTSLPARGSSTVLFADMNANGSNDIVWVTSSGDVSYLELFPVRPNLMSRIENSMGLVVEVNYASAVEHRARDMNVGWDEPIPMATLVVNSVDNYVQGATIEDALHNVRTFEYHAAYYDGIEKAFRGFAQVDASNPGNYSQEPITITSYFDVGAGDDRPHFAGKLLEKHFISEGEPMQKIINTYQECTPGAIGADTPSRPVLWACQASKTVVKQEKMPASEWVETRVEYERDGYGNSTKVSNLGVVSIGGGSCDACEANADPDVFSGPCGEQCLGDEQFSESDFIAPENVTAWLPNIKYEGRSYAREGGMTSRYRAFYDGPDFEGLNLGAATVGLLTREEELVDEDGTTQDVVRNKYNDNAQIEEALYTASDGGDGALFRFTYDATGKDIVHEERSVKKANGTFWILRDYEYHPVLGKVSGATEWYSAAHIDEKNPTSWNYDEFGRMISVVRPGGDTQASPTITFEYEVGTPISAVITKRRSVVGGPQDRISIKCSDGRGRVLQERTRESDDNWLVDGLSIFNETGSETKNYDPFYADDGDCSWDVPADHPFRARKLDGMGREIELTHPDAADHDGVPSFSRSVYEPLGSMLYDERDTDVSENSFGTPNKLSVDGLGRTLFAQRVGMNGEVVGISMSYDGLGNLRSMKDSLGNERSQVRNVGGRILETVDPDRGSTRFSYDATGNPIREEWANGIVVVREYDDLGRKTAEYKDGDEAATRVEFIFDENPNCPMTTCDNGTYKLVGHTYPLGDFGTGEDAFSYSMKGFGKESYRRIGEAEFTLTAEFDNDGGLVSEVFPGGKTTKNTFDDAGRLVAIEGFASDITYDIKGNITSYVTSNGIKTDTTFDLRSFTTQIKSSAIDLSFDYDRAGNIVSIEDAMASSIVSQSATYTYDALGRLSEAVILEGLGSEETLSYGFDLAERIVERESSAAESLVKIGQFDYSPIHPQGVLDAAGTAFEYDASGQVLGRGEDSFTYERHGLISSITQNGEESADFYYNGTGFQVVRVEEGSVVYTPFPQLEVRDGIARYLGVLGTHRIGEHEYDDLATVVLHDDDEDGVIGANDAYAQRDQADFATLLRSAARSMLLDDNGKFETYLHVNQQGSVIARSDAAGEVVERMAYSPYGKLLAASAGETEYNIYAGKDVLKSGYISFGKRIMSPDEGRFLSPDPRHVVMSSRSNTEAYDLMTAYAYARNNPITLVDVGGEAPWSPETLNKIATTVRVAGMGLATVGAALGVASAGVAIGAGTFGIANIVGGVVGFVASFGVEVATQIRSAQKETPNLSRWGAFKQIGKGGWAKIALVSTAGFGSGFATCGVTAAITLATIPVDVLAEKKRISPGAATTVKIVSAIAVGVVTGVGGFDAFADVAGSTGDGLGSTLFNGGTAQAIEGGDTSLGVATDFFQEMPDHLKTERDKRMKNPERRGIVKGIGAEVTKRRRKAAKRAKAAAKAAKAGTLKILRH